MLEKEAQWLAEAIGNIESSYLFPMLNIGSSTEKFRKIDQPWIDKYIFKPFGDKNLVVKHLDIKKASGVDIVGDLTDRTFLKKLTKMKFKSVFCSNVLEHLADRAEVCNAISFILPEDGYVIVSCPFKYPKHSDPMDTMFRPDVSELATLFPNTNLVKGEIIKCGSLWDRLKRNPAVFAKKILRLFMPFYKPKRWLEGVSAILFWLLVKNQVTCVVLQKRPEKY